MAMNGVQVQRLGRTGTGSITPQVLAHAGLWSLLEMHLIHLNQGTLHAQSLWATGASRVNSKALSSAKVGWSCSNICAILSRITVAREWQLNVKEEAKSSKRVKTV